MRRTYTRDELRELWPDAKWFMGDPCPVGQHVRFKGGCGEPSADGYVYGRIVGEYKPPPDLHPHCKTCTCTPLDEDLPPFYGFWQVALDTPYSIQGGGTGGTPDNPEMHPPMKFELVEASHE